MPREESDADALDRIARKISLSVNFACDGDIADIGTVISLQINYFFNALKGKPDIQRAFLDSIRQCLKVTAEGDVERFSIPN